MKHSLFQYYQSESPSESRLIQDRRSNTCCWPAIGLDLRGDEGDGRGLRLFGLPLGGVPRPTDPPRKDVPRGETPRIESREDFSSTLDVVSTEMRRKKLDNKLVSKTIAPRKFTQYFLPPHFLDLYRVSSVQTKLF